MLWINSDQNKQLFPYPNVVFYSLYADNKLTPGFSALIQYIDLVILECNFHVFLLKAIPLWNYAHPWKPEEINNVI